MMLVKSNFYDLVAEAGACSGAIVVAEEGGDLLNGWAKLGGKADFANLAQKAGLLTQNEVSKVPMEEGSN